MKKSRKLLGITMAVTLMASALVGCSSGGDTKEAATTDSNKETEATESADAAGDSKETADSGDKKPVTLVTVSMHGGSDPNAPNYQDINNAFMAEYPYITIEDDSQVSNQEWKTKIAADFSIGNEPDVIQFFTDANASDVLLADKFVTVDEIKAEYPDYAKDTIPDVLALAANPDGVVRAVPTIGFWEGMFCNKALFDQYNLELPTNWENLVKAVETFKENDVTPIAISLNDVPHYLVEFLLLGTSGVEGYTAVPETAPEDWVKALDAIKTLRDLGAFPVDTDSIDNDAARSLFNEGKAAMILEGSWFLPGITDQDNTVVCRFPNIEGGKADEKAIIGGISNGFYITKRAWEDPDKRDAAVKFVMAHTNKDSVQRYWGGNGQAACEVEPADNMTPLGLSGLEFNSGASSISAPTDARLSKEAFNTLKAGIVGISLGESSSEDVINEALEINNR